MNSGYPFWGVDFGATRCGAGPELEEPIGHLASAHPGRGSRRAVRGDPPRRCVRAPPGRGRGSMNERCGAWFVDTFRGAGWWCAGADVSGVVDRCSE